MIVRQVLRRKALPSHAIVRLINATTPLRVDEALEDGFIRILDPEFKSSVQKHAHDRYVDVWLVGLGDMPSEVVGERIPDMDILGCYMSHDPVTHHPVLKVCPEQVMSACRSWNRKIGGALPFAERYATLPIRGHRP
ncbi:MAG TPA: hypothetical protein VHY19_09785 [Steroidobacteraceae bacterium]|jgi:hypothetical protein|nr:hypothetical protein [Steroidobacteraceae bacterium]